MTNRELLNRPRARLRAVDKQRLFLLRVEGTPRPCPACARPVTFFEAAGLDLDHYDFGKTPHACRCPHCGAGLEQVVPLFSIGPLWSWQRAGDWLREQLDKARAWIVTSNPGKRKPDMKKADLLKMLDLSGAEVAPPAQDLVITSPEPSTPPKPASPTALDLDDWALRRGQDLLGASARLQELGLGEHAIADFHGAAFLPDPQLLPGCADPLRHQFVQQLLETPDYQSLHTTTLLNAAAAEIATTAFAEQFAALRQEETKGKDATDREMATLRAVGRAVTKAGEEVEECQEAAAALGLGPGSPGSNDPGVIAALFKRVRGNPTLKRICELAGRYRRVAQSKQRRKATHGLDDLVGVALDGDLGRLLPQELAKLALPEFEDDTLRRLVERQCMCREYRATEPVAKGPILVSVDESGSMEGDKGHTAKALALALAWIARQQGRWCGLVAYSGDSGERLLALPPGRWDEAALMDWLAEFIGGGSSLDVPVRELPDYYQRLKAPVGQTDVVFITDALCHIPEDLQTQFRAWKQRVQARLLSLVIRSEAGDLSPLSDEVHLVPSLAVTEAAVGRVLSV